MSCNQVADLTGQFQPVQGNNPRLISFDLYTPASGDGLLVHTGGTATSTAAFDIGYGVGQVKQLGVFANGQAVFSGPAFYPSTGRVFNDRLWHSILVTYDGTTVIIYIDGILDNRSTNWNLGSNSPISSTLNTSGTTVNLCGNPTSGWTTNAKLKNVNFYNYALSSPELSVSE